MYKGSLTTPPCAEGVFWYVWSQVQTASKEQLDMFKKHLSNDPDYASGHGNSRDLQPLHGRFLVHYQDLQPSNYLLIAIACVSVAIYLACFVYV